MSVSPGSVIVFVGHGGSECLTWQCHCVCRDMRVVSVSPGSVIVFVGHEGSECLTWQCHCVCRTLA